MCILLLPGVSFGDSKINGNSASLIYTNPFSNVMVSPDTCKVNLYKSKRNQYKNIDSNKLTSNVENKETIKEKCN